MPKTVAFDSFVSKVLNSYIEGDFDKFQLDNTQYNKKSEKIIISSLKKLQQRLTSVASSLEHIKIGNLKQKITHIAQDDRLNLLISSIVDDLKDFGETMNVAASGDLTLKMKLRSENDLIGLALNNLIYEVQTKRDALEASDKKSRAILNTAVDSVVTINKVGIIESVNPATLDLFGYSEEELIGENITKLMPESYKRAHDGYLNNYHRTKTKKIIGLGRELTAIKKGGKEFPIYLSVGEVKLSTTSIFVGIMRDISDRMSVETHLQQVNVNLEKQNWIKTNLAELSDFCQRSESLEQLATGLLQKIAKIINIGQGAFYIIKSFEEYKDGDDKLHLIGSYAFERRKKMANTVNFGEGLLGQCVIEKKQILLTQVPNDYIAIHSSLGASKPLNIIAQPILFQDKVVGAMELASFEKFTELHQDMITQLALSIGVSINTTYSQEKMMDMLAESKRLNQELEAQQEELQAANEELSENSEALKLSEKNIKFSNEKLAEKNKSLYEQTAKLERAHAEINQSKIELEEKARELELSSKYKSEFLANMSHELRTPLNSLLLLADKLADNDEANLNQEQIKDLEVIHASGMDLLNLINEILDLAKIESGKVVCHKEIVNLDNIIEKMNNYFLPFSKKKNIRFIFDIKDNLPRTFFSDGLRIEQIIRNLLSNAFKFTDQGCITCRICIANSTEVENLNRKYVGDVLSISIIDTGIGIAEDKSKIIFEAFQQADGSTSRQYGGTGLGLPICKQLAELLGGELTLTSTRGLGSTFTVYLPIEKQELQEQEYVTKSSINRKTLVPSTPSLQGEFLSDDRNTITEQDTVLLIIEDDLVFSKIVMDIAHKKQYKCLLTPTGGDVFDLLDIYRVDGIILDIHLPNVDGLSILCQLKNSPKTKHVPVHIVSAVNNSLECLSSGAVGHLQKPVSEEEIIQVFSKIKTKVSKPNSHILIVDHDTQVQQDIEDCLKTEKITTNCARTQEEAIKMIVNNQYDCIVLELRLPDEGGVGILNNLSLQSIEEIPPVVIYTKEELTDTEKNILTNYQKKMVVKEAKSKDHVLDEVSLFLHSVQSNLIKEQPKKVSLPPDLKKEIELQGKKVLVVDDDARNMLAISSALQKKGLDIFMADNGELALDILANEEKLDIILMDIMMPIMDGYETMRRIRKNEICGTGDIPIIALTANAMSEDRLKCIDAGANDYLSKPVKMKELLSLMKVLLYK